MVYSLTGNKVDNSVAVHSSIAELSHITQFLNPETLSSTILASVYTY